MMNYKVVNSAAINKFEIFETQTDQVVFATGSNDAAKKMCRHLNLGGGFDGQTPTFFLTDIPRPTAA